MENIFNEEEVGFIKHFTVEHYSKIYKKKFVGNFSVKKASMGDSIEIGIVKSDLLRGRCFDEITGRGVPRGIDQLAEMVAVCRVTLVRKPDWFKLDSLDINDPELFTKVFQEVNAFEASFCAPDEKPSGTHSGESEESDDSSGSSPGSGDSQCSAQPGDNKDKTVVGKKVPSIHKIGTV